MNLSNIIQNLPEMRHLRSSIAKKKKIRIKQNAADVRRLVQ